MINSVSLLASQFLDLQGLANLEGLEVQQVPYRKMAFNLRELLKTQNISACLAFLCDLCV
ncbi:MAG: hypothetical protein QME52_02010 [Bacteroidota bacterium]|nr:hypothetical protein [Bacteroidota bacterium]